MISLIRRFGADRSGLSLIEYGLIVALIAITLITIMTNLGVTLSGFYNTISTTLASVS
jgi:pilus assembly protein Flp/PilA